MRTKPARHLALKQHDQAIEWARRAIEITPNKDIPYPYLIVALALTGQESQAHEALQRYLATPGRREDDGGVEAEEVSVCR